MDSGIAAQTGGGTSNPADARGAERFTLLVRAAKLVADDREYLCVLRDVSATGVKLRLFHAVPEADTYRLELGNGERHGMQVMWRGGDHAGFRFDTPIDVPGLIDDRSNAFPKRQMRINLERPALLNSGALTFNATLHNISQSGACIECDQRLLLRQLVQVEIKGLPALYARVCWRRQPLYGLVFEQGFTLEELARHVARLHQGIALPQGQPAARAL